MDRSTKILALILILIITFSTLSLLMVEPASAQTPTPTSVPLSTPSVPEFSLKYFTQPFDSGPVITINPYTGKNETIFPGYHYNTRNVKITVKNQPFNPFTDSNGNHVYLFYNVTLKGHYEDTWSHYPDSTSVDLFNASATDYTTIDVSLEGYPQIPDGALLDFRLQTVIGHYNYDRTPSGIDYVTGFTAYQTSDWSNPQTLTVGVGETSPSTSANPTPTVPEFPLLAVLPLFLLVLSVAVIVRTRKITVMNPKQQIQK